VDADGEAIVDARPFPFTCSVAVSSALLPEPRNPTLLPTQASQQALPRQGACPRCMSVCSWHHLPSEHGVFDVLPIVKAESTKKERKVSEWKNTLRAGWIRVRPSRRCRNIRRPVGEKGSQRPSEAGMKRRQESSQQVDPRARGRSY